MTRPLDTKEVVTTNQIVITNMLEISVLIELLMEKGIVTEEELRGKIRGR
jgi:hypothetical protein